MICKHKSQIISKERIIEKIKVFYKKEGRIPLKREFRSYTAARKRFQKWNNAIKAAGFNPNPVMFAKKHIAKDGHKCDSLAEKIIDDWFYTQNIAHTRSVRYPGNSGFSVDFLVKDYWIEFFGLFGQHKKYDELRKKKLEVIKNYNLNLVEIYPKDLFPKNNLHQILSILLNL